MENRMSRAVSPSLSTASTSTRNPGPIRFVSEDVTDLELDALVKSAGRGRGRIPRSSRPVSAASSVASIAPGARPTPPPPSEEEGHDVVGRAEGVIVVANVEVKMEGDQSAAKPRGVGRTTVSQSGSDGLALGLGVLPSAATAPNEEKRSNFVNDLATVYPNSIQAPVRDRDEEKRCRAALKQMIALIEEELGELRAYLDHFNVLAEIGRFGIAESRGESKSKARKEFFTKITQAADDGGRQTQS